MFARINSTGFGNFDSAFDWSLFASLNLSMLSLFEFTAMTEKNSHSNGLLNTKQKPEIKKIILSISPPFKSLKQRSAVRTRCACGSEVIKSFLIEPAFYEHSSSEKSLRCGFM